MLPRNVAKRFPVKYAFQEISKDDPQAYLCEKPKQVHSIVWNVAMEQYENWRAKGF